MDYDGMYSKVVEASKYPTEDWVRELVSSLITLHKDGKIDLSQGTHHSLTDIRMTLSEMARQGFIEPIMVEKTVDVRVTKEMTVSIDIEQSIFDDADEIDLAEYHDQIEDEADGEWRDCWETNYENIT
jgi:hypothetical protein